MCALCMVCVLHNKGVQVDTVTVPHGATEGPCSPTTDALLRVLLLACSGLPSPSLSLAFFLSFFSEPIFLSEVLIWGAGQWREGREGGPRERRTGKRERRRRVVIAADGRPFVPSFPGSSLEPPRLQLR